MMTESDEYRFELLPGGSAGGFDLQTFGVS